MLSNIKKYLISIFSLAVVAVFSHAFLRDQLMHYIEINPEHEMLLIFLLIAILFALSFVIFYISHLIKLPSFVIAIFFGIAAKPLLLPITENEVALSIMVGLGATLILFSGGIETPFHNFKKNILKIFSLSFVGLLITAFLFSLFVWLVGGQMWGQISMVTAVLLGAILASTDPAAIIPVLKKLRFKNPSTKDIIISESAVTDVVGTLLTIVFLAYVTTSVNFLSIQTWYGSIFNGKSGLILLKQLFFGGIFGLFGYLLLEGLSRFKKKYEQEFEADSAFFLFVPIVIFVLALIFGGSGYLAAFIAGLIFHLADHLQETEHFFNSLVEGFFKPVIFILLGSLVDPVSLLAYAPLGILAAIVFMAVIRPIAVFVSLLPFYFWGKDKMSIRDMCFISFVRETGAIPAVLMVTVVGLGIKDIHGLVEVGMWTILLTLIIEPIFTPWVAKKLNVADILEDKKKIKLSTTPVVILASRGHTFIRRLPRVIEWARKQNISRIKLLLCLEDKYTEELEKEIKETAEKEFIKYDEEAKKLGLEPIDFVIVSRKGLLQTNINELAENDGVTAIFVGTKMLDYRLSEIKKLGVPLYFLD
ncbi:MAG: Sodium/proton antiporter, CPA1 family [Parcubacteria group bacterium GW2011_GWE2_39_37]|nr:MAG: Sodium/proton antiporter, CPA1 family [Parcubacteria group bacterium GW2011_GWE2_39_37]